MRPSTSPTRHDGKNLHYGIRVEHQVALFVTIEPRIITDDDAVSFFFQTPFGGCEQDLSSMCASDPVFQKERGPSVSLNLRYVLRFSPLLCEESMFCFLHIACLTMIDETK